MKRIYLDHAATTPVEKKTAKILEQYATSEFGNPGSIHALGRGAREALKDSRKRIASVLHAMPEEIIFTSCATEANNLAIFGAIKKSGQKKPHIVTSGFEHHSILEPIRVLEEHGEADVTWLDPDDKGFTDPKNLREVLREETVLVSIIYANNEVGSVQDIKKLARVVKEFRHIEGTNYKPYPLFHTDAAQAPGHLPITMDSLGVDLASFSSQKFYGPKGAGFLYKKRGVELEPVIYGGDQESKMRGGTQNVGAIVAMAETLVEALEKQEKEEARLGDLALHFASKMKSEAPGAKLNSPEENRLPGLVNFSFGGILGEQMVIELDAKGIAIATGSACTTESSGPSHVILSMGLGEKRAQEAVRFSMGRSTTKRDLDKTIEVIKSVINKQSKI